MAIAFIRRSRLSYKCSEGNHQWTAGGTEEIHSYCAICQEVSETPHSYSHSYQWADDCSECTVTYGCSCGYVKGSETSSELRENNRRPATCTEPEKRDYVAVFTNYPSSSACSGWHDFSGADPATGHSMGDWQYVDSVTHIAYCENTDTYLNQACTYSEEEGHEETTPATCSNGAFCQKCNHHFGDVRPDNHVWNMSEWVDIEDQTYHAVVCKEENSDGEKCNGVHPTLRSNHIYGDWVTNEDYHWKECVGSSISETANGLENEGCGKRTSEGAHTASAYTKCYEVNSCSVCGIELEGYGEHELSNTAKYNDTYHWFECIYNHKHSDNPYSTDVEQHTLSAYPENTPCTGIVNCTTSGCMYETQGTKHSWNTTWSSDELNHWHECSNNSDHKKDGASHTYNDASNYYCDEYVPCNVCSRKSDIKGTSHEEWEDYYRYNDTEHWIKCVNCNAEKPGYSSAHTGDLEWTYKDDTEHQRGCTTCSWTESEEHSVDESSGWSTDETYHWKDCTVCSGKLGKSLHDEESTWSKDETHHWKECTVCDYITTDKSIHASADGAVANCMTKVKCSTCDYEMSEYGPCVYGDWKSLNDQNHVRYCTLNDSHEPDTDEHHMVVTSGYVAATCKATGTYAKSTCKECEYTTGGGVIPMIPHNFGDWEYKDENQHYRLCSYLCGTEETEDHESDETWKSDAQFHYTHCIGCGCEMSKGEHTEPQLWSSNDTHHYKLCRQCDVRLTSGVHSGGTATCLSKATCSTCGKEYGEIGDHTWRATYAYDNDKHWQVCTLDSSHTQNESEHNIQYGAISWNYTDDEEGMCSAHSRKTCGETNCSYSALESATVIKGAIIEPTCTSTGSFTCYATVGDKSGFCSVDHIIPKLGHEWQHPADGSASVSTCSRSGCTETCYHSYAKDTSDWFPVDDTYHNKTRACPDCGYASNYMALWPDIYNAGTYKHSFNTDGVCICGQTCKHDYTSDTGKLFNAYDSESHWRKCNICGHITDVAEHSFKAGAQTCLGCGYLKGMLA